MFCFAVLLSIVSVEAAIVTVEQGTLNGTYLKARGGRMFNAFYSIPYSEPPVGNLRFKAPVEAKSWNGILDASIPPSPCIEYSSTYRNKTKGEENCLYLNVYTPLNAKKGDNLSVIVYLYGGAFQGGSNMGEGPQYIMSRNVILVNPNYRGGVFGFLSTGDTVIPGNFGLKDQNLALKWVKKNIHHFGGDPNKVTLQGHSAGSSSVHFHTLSPASKGLFQKVILQSGTALGSMSYFGADVARSIAKEFATKVGCANTDTSQGIYDCLMQKDAAVAILNPYGMYIWDTDPGATFRPTIEDKNVPDAFLTEVPNKMGYHSPDLPWIIGMTTGEAAFKVARYLVNGGKRAKEIDENFKLLFPITLQYLWNTKPKYLDYISQTIRRHYFKDKHIGDETAFEMVNMYTEGLYGVNTIDSILTYPGLKYVYLYDYIANVSTQNDIADYDQYLGVSHSDELNLIFYRDYAAPLLTEQDVIFSEELIKRWVNFIDTGNPNFPVKVNETIMGIWEPMSSRRIEHLYINLNGRMQTDLYEGKYEFWKSLPIGSKYYGD